MWGKFYPVSVKDHGAHIKLPVSAIHLSGEGKKYFADITLASFQVSTKINDSPRQLSAGER